MNRHRLWSGLHWVIRHPEPLIAAISHSSMMKPCALRLALRSL